MKKNLNKLAALGLSAALILGLAAGCGSASTGSEQQETVTQVTASAAQTQTSAEAAGAVAVSKVDYGEEAHVIVLTSAQNADGTCIHSASLDGEAVEEYDYVWHADPSQAHEDVKNSPAEYFTGDEPDTDAAAYIAHDIYYYPQLDESGFQKVQYDDDQEWAYYYTAEGYEEFIFATLPVTGSGIPTEMMHSEEEAYENAVLHITQPGTYILEGEWQGQILVDLGDTDDTFADESAKVTLVLNGVDVTCTVAPAMVFYSVYECDNTWEDQTSWSSEADTSEAGAVVIIADGTVNNFTGENVYRMLKAKYKSDDDQSAMQNSVTLQKKARKLDGAVYSYVSMNIDGEPLGTGVLNITAGYEGLGTELHLTLNGGNVNVFSQDDGVNVNEDGISVFTVNGGSIHVLSGLGREGDGIDSNGYVVINGGTVISIANPNSDSGLDSDRGTYINGGTVVALGSAMDWAESDGTENEGQATMNLRFASAQSADEAIIVTDLQGSVVFAYDPEKDEVTGGSARKYQGAILSAPTLQVGESYYVYVGGDVEGEDVEGVYDVSTVTGFSAEAKQQGYTSAGTLGGFGGPMGRGGFGGQPGSTDGNTDGSSGAFGGHGFPGGQGQGSFDPSQGGMTPPDGQIPSDGDSAQQGMTPPDGAFGGHGFPGQNGQSGDTDGNTGNTGPFGGHGFPGGQGQGSFDPSQGGMTPPDGQLPSDGDSAQQGMTPPDGAFGGHGFPGQNGQSGDTDGNTGNTGPFGGQGFPGGQGQGGLPGGTEGQTGETGETTVIFQLSQKVNGFSGVTDASGTGL